MSKSLEFTLPAAPEDLCFTSADFIASDFDVDNFLHEHRKLATLEIMRDDLGVYLKILRSAMIELINKDYADFVNLSKDLIGLDRAIERLQSPLGQIREEVLQIRQTLDSATAEIARALDEHRRIREEKQCMYSLSRVYKSVSKLKAILVPLEDGPNLNQEGLDLLERAATEYNHLKFQSSKCASRIAPEVTKQCEALEKNLTTSLANQLFAIVHGKSETPKDRLTRCLRIYVNLDKTKEAEHLVRTKIVAPAIEDIIVEENIYNDPLGLEGLYDRLLNILKVQLKGLIILESSLDTHQKRGFNFLVNSYWVDVEEKIELRLKSIFAAGNPDIFHQRYLESLTYLRRIEEHCGDGRILQELKDHPLYSQFLKKWNLPIYFQIRFQEIAGGVEQVLGLPGPPEIKSGEHRGFALNSTEIVWKSLEKCWSEGVFLPQLLHQFWKLCLQICSRFRVWVKGSVRGSETVGDSRLQLLVFLYTDVMKFEERIGDLVGVAEKKLLGIFQHVEDILRDSVREIREGLTAELPAISEEIVKELLGKSLISLKQVSDIPRLFRRTMRERPTQPCAYVKGAVEGLINFRNVHQDVGNRVVDQWMLMALSQLAEQYFISVKDVLESVQKTEESLRRLKKIRDKSSGTTQPESQGISDDEKIRIQLEIDVHTFCDSVRSFNIDVSSIDKLGELVQIVEAAVKSKS